MTTLWELFRAVAGTEIGLWRAHARRRAGLVAALALLGLVVAVLAIALAIVGLASWVGTVRALAICLGAAVLGALVVLLLLALERRRHARSLAAQAALRTRLLRIAGLALLPQLRASPMLLLGLGVLAAGLFAGSGSREQDQATDQPTSPDT